MVLRIHCVRVLLQTTSCTKSILLNSKSSILHSTLLLLSTHFQYPNVAVVSMAAKAKKIHNRDQDTINVLPASVEKNCMPKRVYQNSDQQEIAGLIKLLLRGTHSNKRRRKK